MGCASNPATVKKYLFGTDIHTSWEPGSPVRFTGEWQGKTYEDKEIVLAYQENKKLQYSYWSYMPGIEYKPENYMTVTYEISGEDANVHLVLTQENIPDEKTKEHSEENRKKVLNAMKQLLES